MLRTTLLLAALLLTACGIDPALPVVGEVEARVAPSPALAPPALEVRALPLRLEAQLRPAGEVLQVRALAAPDGTQVRYLLGVMGCGVLVVAQGTASVQGGAFDIAYETPVEGPQDVTLYYQLDEDGSGACEPDRDQLFEVPVTVPGTIDLSTPPEPSSVGCWLFELGA